MATIIDSSVRRDLYPPGPGPGVSGSPCMAEGRCISSNRLFCILNAITVTATANSTARSQNHHFL